MLQQAMRDSGSSYNGKNDVHILQQKKYLSVFHGSFKGTRNEPVIPSGSVGDLCFK